MLKNSLETGVALNLALQSGGNQEGGLKPKPTGRGAWRNLSEDLVLDEALTFIERHTIDALTMRKLGPALGINPKSLYHYFPTRSALLDGVGVRIGAEVPSIDWANPEWKIEYLKLGVALLSLARKYPRGYALFTNLGTQKGPVARMSAEQLKLLRTAGFDEHLAVEARAILGEFIGGFCHTETKITLRSKRYRPELNVAARNETFELGMSILFDGLERSRDHQRAAMAIQGA